MKKRLFLVSGVALAVTAASLLYFFWLVPRQLRENERMASAALKTIATAQADFRANDRDGDKIQNFWTGDVAGLYYLPDFGSKSPMKLIDRRIADADASPIPRHAKRPVPYHGYYFAALEADGSDDPPQAYKGPGGAPSFGPYYNSSRFGFVAYPAESGGTGRVTFILNEGNTMFKLQSDGTRPTKWPSDPVIRKQSEWGNPQ